MNPKHDIPIRGSVQHANTALSAEAMPVEATASAGIIPDPPAEDACLSGLRPGKSGDEQEDAERTDVDDDFVNDVHEPADELPEDCRVDYEPENADSRGNG